MVETWVFSDATAPELVEVEETLETLRGRIAAGQLENWLTSSNGRSLAVVSNTERAMVMLLAGEGDAGEHATDPGADGTSGGYALANGQHDTYPDAETVPLTEALRIVGHILAHGTPPADATWTIDREEIERQETMTYTNPVIPGFHPDPSVCRVGEDYYLACSSFEYYPGVPIFHSRDLVHWTQIGNVLDRPSQLHLPAETPSSGGIYAPTLRHHDGRFWLITTNVSHGGTFIVTAADPAGPWSDPIPCPEIHGIDPDLAWDENGDCWCTVAGNSQARIDPETGRVLGPQSPIWSGTPGAQAPEGPHLYRIGEHWYLLLSEGGTERGHSISIARGPAPDGPFEPCPANPVITHRSTGKPIQNTGHADLVQGPDGSWWMVLLGVRPGGGTPGWHVLGRETFLVPVEWVDGWPVVGELAPEMDAPSRPPHPVAPAPVRDDFDVSELEPRWISPRTRRAEACTTAERPGWLSLRARGGSLDSPEVTFVGRRQQHRSCRVRVLMDPAEGSGGLGVRLDEHHHYEIEADDVEVRVLARIGSVSAVVAHHAVGPGPVVLRVETEATHGWRDPRMEPDVVILGVEDSDGGFVVLARLDGRYLSTEVAGGFTGRVIGMYAATGTVHFDWLDYESLD